MRGHTSDRILAAALASMFIRAKEEVVLRKGYPEDQAHFEGRADAAEDLAIALGVDEKFHETIRHHGARKTIAIDCKP